MKPILLLFILLTLGFAGRSATITGTVSINTSFYTHQSSWGTKVYLRDTVFLPYGGHYVDSTFVNSSGAYSFTVPSTTTTGSFRIVAWACNYGWNSSLYSYTGSNITVGNIGVYCTGPQIIDSIKNATTNLPETGKTVYLLDSTASLYFLDSAVVDAMGSVTFSIPPVITSGFLRIYTTACGLQSQIVSYSGTGLAAPKMLICGGSTTVSGTLTSVTTSAAIPYYKVYLTDSSATSVLYRDSAYTDASGNYSFFIHPTITAGTMIVSAQACGSRIANRSAFSGASLTLNLGVCSSSVATISGDVTYWYSLPSPMYNQKVYLLDSTLTHYILDSTVTDYAGHYSFAVPPTFISGTLRVYTHLCGTTMSEMVYYSGSSINVPVLVNCTSSQSILYGATHLAGGSNSGPTMIYLILKEYDAALSDTTLTAIDSFTTIGNTGTFYKSYAQSVYVMTDSGRGRLLLKAALQPSHASYGSYLPAYHAASLNWNGAVAVDSSSIYNPQAFHFYANADINLPAGVNPGGSGFIGGSVLLGANKSAAVGDPLASRILLLTTASGQAVGFAYSTSAGQFSFSNLANGSYLIFGDAWGKNNPPLAVAISGASPTVNNIIFEENSTDFKGHYNVLGVSVQPALAAITIYPNPVSSRVSLQGLPSIDGDKQIVLRDIRGLVLADTRVKAGSNASIPTAQLPAGMYMLQLQTTAGTANYKFIKQ